MFSEEKETKLKQVLVWEMTRKDFREGIDEGRIKGAIIPAGSTEQHNEHLAMIHDTVSAIHIARQVALNLYPNVVVTTPLAIGVSEHWMDHKGTLTLRPEIFGELLYDVCNSLKRAGVKNILILNGHAGNSGPIMERLDEFRKKLNIKLKGCSYWEAYSKEIVEQYMESKKSPAHAAEFETSFALAAFPDKVHMEKADEYDKAKLTISNPEQAQRDRLYHEEAYLATAEKGSAMIAVAVDWVTEIMKEMIS